MQDGEPFALADVWPHWRSPDCQSRMDTFAIITVQPNELVEQPTHHDRMPRILKLSDWQRWLEPGNAEQPPIDLLRSFEAELIKAWRADAAINNITNTGPELGEPVKDEGETQLGCSNLFRVYK